MVKLSLQNLNLHYDNGFHAVKDVSLDIKEGEIITLLGPSGCGKTSLLRTVAGFNMPSSGKVFLNDQDITDLSAQKRNTGMIFQNYALWPNMKIKDNITYGLKIRKMDKLQIQEKLDHIFSQIKLYGQEDKYPTQLSGGQQQRVALARAVIIEPTVLLCDEPLSNLDYKLRVSLRTEIRDIAKNLGITVIYVTHDQNEALAISDRIAIIKEGRIIQIGTPMEIYNDPDTLFVATFIGENNVLNGKVASVEGKTVRVNLASGEEIEVKVGEELEVGTEVKLLTRYDDVSVSKGQDGNKIRGKIFQKAFMGGYFQVQVQLSDESLIVVNETENIEEQMKRKVNSEIELNLITSNILLFKDDLRVR